MNRLITFEGIEGSGKSTQIRMAGECLRKTGVPFVITGEPGGTPLGNKIREILLNRDGYRISAEAELYLFIAARSQHLIDVILPALKQGKWVLCDRFTDATLAYQGFGRGLNIDFIKGICNISSLCPKPGLTILLDLPVDMGLERAMNRIATIEGRGLALEDRFEREDREFHQRVREGYLAIAGGEPERCRIIDASRDAAAVHEDICGKMRELIRSDF